jgi:hypothetical protein
MTPPGQLDDETGRTPEVVSRMPGPWTVYGHSWSVYGHLRPNDV